MMNEKYTNIMKGLCRLGAFYFGICLFAWVVVLALGSWPFLRQDLMSDVSGVDWLMFLHAVPALALMACFSAAGRYFKKGDRRAKTLFVIATLGTISLAAVELGFSFNNLRIDEQRIYVNWLWYIDKLGPRRSDELVYGYIDPNGETVISPGFDYAYPFHEGLAVVREGRLYGFIDKSGDYVIKPQFIEANSFSEEMASVIIKERGGAGYINRSGEVVISPRFISARCFSEGLAAVRDEKGKWGYIDKSGNYVIEPEWDEAHTFFGGFGLATKNDQLFVIKRRDLSATKVQAKGYPGWTRPFSEGLAPVQIGFTWGYVDGNGKFAISPQFEWAFNFNEGLALVESRDGFGYIDKSGRFVLGSFKAQQGMTSFVVGPMRACAGLFSEGLVPLTMGNGKWGYRAKWQTNFCDSNANTVIKTNFMQAKSFAGGFAAVRNEKGMWGYIDNRGNVVVKPQFLSAGPFSEERACVAIRR